MKLDNRTKLVIERMLPIKKSKISHFLKISLNFYFYCSYTYIRIHHKKQQSKLLPYFVNIFNKHVYYTNHMPIYVVHLSEITVGGQFVGVYAASVRRRSYCCMFIHFSKS